ncbi:hypothetical protein DFH09DRAFT_1308936 [Mycena vulgaris]|nr:hypothetical protein DFH09DRAFT_1308936 [Mycena vulgaris]
MAASSRPPRTAATDDLVNSTSLYGRDLTRIAFRDYIHSPAHITGNAAVFDNAWVDASESRTFLHKGDSGPHSLTRLSPARVKLENPDLALAVVAKAEGEKDPRAESYRTEPLPADHRPITVIKKLVSDNRKN